MDLHQLRHFIALAEHGSFTRAAQASFITQSAFSRSIQALEQNLGCLLVERGIGGRPVTLTSHGQALKLRARDIVDVVANLRADIVGLDPEENPPLVFGCGPLPAACLVPAALGKFLDDHVETRIDLRVKGPDALKEQLDNGEIEFIVADLRHIESSKGYVTQVLRPRRFQLFCRPHHPLLFDKLSIDALANYPIGSNSLPAELRVLLSERVGRRGVFFNVERLQTDVLAQLVMSSDTIGIAPEDLVQQLALQGTIEHLNFTDSPQGLRVGGTCYGVVYRADRHLSARAERMIALIVEVDSNFVAMKDESVKEFRLAI